MSTHVQPCKLHNNLSGRFWEVIFLFLLPANEANNYSFAVRTDKGREKRPTRLIGEHAPLCAVITPLEKPDALSAALERGPRVPEPARPREGSVQSHDL